MAAKETHTAEIMVERNDKMAETDGFDEYAVIVRNPFGTHPDGFLGTVQDHVRSVADFSGLADGQKIRNFGSVTYDADEVREITIEERYKNSQ